MAGRKPGVSIIIPAYNAEKTIGRCLESIRRQTYTQFEAIIVNDGSTDATAEETERFALDDRRFIFINRKINMGVSETRNEGIARARGKYLQFVDSDDYLEEHATERLVTACTESGCEMAVSDYYRIVGRKKLIKGDIAEGGLILRNEYVGCMMEAPANFYYGVLWNKMYLAGIVKGMSLNFSCDLDWCEDLRFNLEYLLYVCNVCVIPHPTYYYMRQKGSLSSVQNVRKENGKVKKILFGYYKELYQAADLYEENWLKIQRYYFDFARDKTKAVEIDPDRVRKKPEKKSTTQKSLSVLVRQKPSKVPAGQKEAKEAGGHIPPKILVRPKPVKAPVRPKPAKASVRQKITEESGKKKTAGSYIKDVWPRISDRSGGIS